MALRCSCGGLTGPGAAGPPLGAAPVPEERARPGSVEQAGPQLRPTGPHGAGFVYVRACVRVWARTLPYTVIIV